MTEKKNDFIASLERLHAEKDRGALSALRRSLSPDAEAAAYPYVVPFLRGEDRWKERAYLLIAGLFALHPSQGGLTLGQAMYVVAKKSGSTSIELRFVALLNTHPDDLGEHLRHAVTLAQSHEVLLDWQSLLRGVLSWNMESRWVQRQWARDFWAGSTIENEEETRS